MQQLYRDNPWLIKAEKALGVAGQITGIGSNIIGGATGLGSILQNRSNQQQRERHHQQELDQRQELLEDLALKLSNITTQEANTQELVLVQQEVTNHGQNKTIKVTQKFSPFTNRTRTRSSHDYECDSKTTRAWN